VKRAFVLTFVLLGVLTLALPGCGKREKTAGGDEATQTIAPATPQPAPSETEAMTQTIEIGDGRSVNEGGALANDASTDTTATLPSTATTATSTAAPPAPTTTTR